jgi:hypothetical protein
MPELAAQVEIYSVVIAIGGYSVRLNTTSADFLEVLQARYIGFVSRESSAQFELDIDFFPTERATSDPEVCVSYRSGNWLLERGDFVAEWSPAASRGRIRQTPTAYSTDSVLRIVHTLLLAKSAGFLMHAASAIRNGRAFLFAGESGAGKTTISSLAPSDARLLTDEISYVRNVGERYIAFGTPFTGDLGIPGENTSAPVAAVYLLAKGLSNSIEPVRESESARAVLANTLFFAEDSEMVRMVFQAACDFVHRVPVFRLTFVPDARVWEMIR